MIYLRNVILAGAIQDYLIGGSNLQRGCGGFVLLILPDYLFIFLDFSENYP